MRPKPLGHPRDHYWKVTDMAHAVGVSLVDEWEAGQLTTDGHAAMIDRCRGCGHAKTCARLLEDGPVLEEAPGYCENRAVFDWLAKTDGA